MAFFDRNDYQSWEAARRQLNLEANRRYDPNSASDVLRDLSRFPELQNLIPSAFHDNLNTIVNNPSQVSIDALRGFREIYLEQGSNAYEHTQNLMYQKHLLNLLEVLQMPIANPNTPNEMDYVNFDLLDRTTIDSAFIYSFNDLCHKKVDFSLSKNDEDDSSILWNAKFADGSTAKHIISKDLFEEVIYRIVHVDKNKRIEQTPEFSAVITELINQYIAARLSDRELHLRSGSHLFNNGIGIIHDIKAGQDIGTFDRVEINITDGEKKAECFVHDIFLSLRTEKELAEIEDRFEYHFFNLEQNLIYVLNPAGAANSVRKADFAEFTLELNMSGICLNDIVDDIRLEQIKVAQNLKNTMNSVSPDSPLYSEHYEEFRDARMSIVKASQEKAEKKKLSNMFFDIEL